jgi:hypothetical protein
MGSALKLARPKWARRRLTALSLVILQVLPIHRLLRYRESQACESPLTLGALRIAADRARLTVLEQELSVEGLQL